MNNNMFISFIQETIQRLFQKSPKFFKLWQIVYGGLILLTGVPYTLTQFGVSLPEPINTMSNKAVAFFAAGAWLMSRLTVKSTPVAQTEEGKAITLLDSKKLPFTTKTEAKEIEETIPQPPIIDDKNIETPKT